MTRKALNIWKQYVLFRFISYQTDDWRIKKEYKKFVKQFKEFKAVDGVCPRHGLQFLMNLLENELDPQRALEVYIRQMLNSSRYIKDILDYDTEVEDTDAIMINTLLSKGARVNESILNNILDSTIDEDVMSISCNIVPGYLLHLLWNHPQNAKANVLPVQTFNEGITKLIGTSWNNVTYNDTIIDIDNIDSLEFKKIWVAVLKHQYMYCVERYPFNQDFQED